MTRGNTHATCPYCGCIDLMCLQQPWPPLKEDGDKGVLRCKYCDCDYDVTLHVERSFTSSERR